MLFLKISNFLLLIREYCFICVSYYNLPFRYCLLIFLPFLLFYLHIIVLLQFFNIFSFFPLNILFLKFVFILNYLVQFSHSVVSDSLWPRESQHARPPCPSPTPRVHSNSCPSSQWGHPAISSSVGPFSSCPQSLPASGSFPMSQLFAWGGQSTGVSASASVLPVNTQDWSPLGWTGWISL